MNGILILWEGFFIAAAHQTWSSDSYLYRTCIASHSYRVIKKSFHSLHSLACHQNFSEIFLLFCRVVYYLVYNLHPFTMMMIVHWWWGAAINLYVWLTIQTNRLTDWFDWWLVLIILCIHHGSHVMSLMTVCVLCCIEWVVGVECKESERMLSSFQSLRIFIMYQIPQIIIRLIKHS